LKKSAELRCAQEQRGACPVTASAKNQQLHSIHLTFVTLTCQNVGSLSLLPADVRYVSKPAKPDNHVLVVDDSPIYQHLIAAHLREWGFEVLAATNGLQAWEILRRPGAPVLALIDWVMPGMDGVELCRKLRSHEAREEYVYTILLTAKQRAC
jgi:PleD family two-component response regulator